MDTPTPPTTSSPNEVRPQAGPQEEFLRLPPDVQIAVYGGAAGGGKTWALLTEPLYHIQTTPGFGAVIFRRTYPEIRNEGGLWDSSYELYLQLGAKPNLSDLSWTFPPHGNAITFAHMQHDHDRFKWHGAQVPLFGFDELNTFTEAQFFYMLTRNRSTCGVVPYTRATTNPDADSWVATLIAYWLDADGFARPERSGEVHWFIRDDDDNLIWDYDVGGYAALRQKYPPPEYEPISFTFVPAKLDDNQILMRKDPSYRTKLLNMPTVERERLLAGNWKIRPAAGLLFDRAWFRVVEHAPHDVLARIRYWDKAGTVGTTSHTVGVKMALTTTGRFVVESVIRGQWRAADRNVEMLNAAKRDGPHTWVIVEQEPGSGGKESAEISQSEFSQAGYYCEIDKPVGDKVARAEPLAWHAKAGNVAVVAASWNDEYLAELHNFPTRAVKDQVDASSGAFNALKRLYDQWQRDQDAGTDDAVGVPADEIGPRFL